MFLPHTKSQQKLRVVMKEASRDIYLSSYLSGLETPRQRRRPPTACQKTLCYRCIPFPPWKFGKNAYWYQKFSHQLNFEENPNVWQPWHVIVEKNSRFNHLNLFIPFGVLTYTYYLLLHSTTNLSNKLTFTVKYISHKRHVLRPIVINNVHQVTKI